MLDREGTSRPERRRALIDRELDRYKVDIAALSETRLADVGEEHEANYTFFWSGKPASVKRESGVGFAIKSCLVPKLIGKPKAINDRLMVVKIPLPQKRTATIISVYAPTMQHTDEYKDQFYTALKAEISTVPTKDKLIILGDFNARVGTDWTTWAGVLGKHGVGKCNSNGELLLETCMSHRLTITNTYFQLPLRNRTSWMHPRSKHWHLIDYVLVRQQDRQDVRVTKSMCGADCWTDHRLIVSKLKLVIQPQKRPQGLKAPKKMDPARIADPVVKATLMTQLSEIMKDQTVDPENIGGSWTHFTDSVHKVSMETVGAPSRVHQDWFDDQNADIQQLIDQKHQLFRSHLSDPSSSSKKDAYQCAKRTCQRELRQMQNQ